MLAVNETSRPPYVVFQERYAEDRKATMEQGKYVARPTDWVVVRQAGNKDSAEFEVESWFERISKNAGYPREWVAGFKEQYAKWKSGQTLPVNGTAVRSWPTISPAQAEMLVSIGVLTVEDLAAANEHTLSRIGIGARELQTRAKAWLDSAQKIGVTAEELASLRAQVAALVEQNNVFRQELVALRPGPVASAPQVTETDPFA